MPITTARTCPSQLSTGGGKTTYVIEHGNSVGVWNITIPNLKPGNYLIRHETTNLEASLQFYPECAQLEVTGDGDSTPSEDYLVEFPGAYSPDDPGLWMAGQLYNRTIGHSIYVSIVFLFFSLICVF